MSAGNSAMQLQTGAGWTRGVDSVLRAEFGRWFRTRTWWSQIIIWALAVNGILLIVLLSPQAAEISQVAPSVFNGLLSIAGPIGVCIVMMSSVIGEKQSGTAAWVLSKPVSRAAFIAAKLAANAAGIMLTMVLVQGVLAYALVAFLGHVRLPALGLLAALGIHGANLLFYLALTLMLGAILNRRGAVLGIPMAFLFVQQFLPSLYAPLADVLPYYMFSPGNGPSATPLAAALMVGTPIPTLLPLFTTLGAAIVFVAVALWGFQQQEL